MALDAKVYCNCWREGRTKPTEIPADIITRYLDDDDRIPDEPWNDLVTWAENACEHPYMRAFDLRLSNAWGRNVCLEVLKDHGGDERFPNLLKVIHGVGVRITPEIAGLALPELEDFRSINVVMAAMYVDYAVEPDRLGPIDGMIFSYSSQFVGFDADGLYVLPQNGKRHKDELFRAKHVRHTLIATDTRGVAAKVLYEDLDSDAKYECTTAAHTSSCEIGISCEEYNVGTSGRFASFCNVIERLVQASLDTGNPIIYSEG